jgi:hypothetical protein
LIREIRGDKSRMEDSTMLHRASCTAALWIAFLTVPIVAHHGFAAYWNSDKTITIQGTVTKFDWMNPHTYLYLDVKDSTGKLESWAIELYDVGKLTRAGLAKDSLKIGDGVTVFGFPAKENAVFDYLDTDKNAPSAHAKAKRFARGKEITLANGMHIVMPL